MPPTTRQTTRVNNERQARMDELCDLVDHAERRNKRWADEGAGGWNKLCVPMCKPEFGRLGMSWWKQSGYGSSCACCIAKVRERMKSKHFIIT